MRLLKIALGIQFVVYAALPWLYVDAMIKRIPEFDSVMGKSVYPGIDFNNVGTRAALIILLSMVARHVIMTSAWVDSVLFHGVQLITMGFFSHLDWNDPGAQQFLGTHAAFVVMLCLAKALDGGDGNRNGATKKTKQK